MNLVALTGDLGFDCGHSSIIRSFLTTALKSMDIEIKNKDDVWLEAITLVYKVVKNNSFLYISAK